MEEQSRDPASTVWQICRCLVDPQRSCIHDDDFVVVKNNGLSTITSHQCSNYVSAARVGINHISIALSHSPDNGRL